MFNHTVTQYQFQFEKLFTCFHSQKSESSLCESKPDTAEQGRNLHRSAELNVHTQPALPAHVAAKGLASLAGRVSRKAGACFAGPIPLQIPVSESCFPEKMQACRYFQMTHGRELDTRQIESTGVQSLFSEN